MVPSAAIEALGCVISKWAPHPVVPSPTSLPPPLPPQGCIRREGTSEAAPEEAVGQAVGGGCQSGWGRLLSVTNAIEAGTCRQRNSGWT